MYRVTGKFLGSGSMFASNVNIVCLGTTVETFRSPCINNALKFQNKIIVTVSVRRVSVHLFIL